MSHSAGSYSCMLLSHPGGCRSCACAWKLGPCNHGSIMSCVSAADSMQQEALQKLSDVNGLTFSNNGKFLAAGGDGGWLTVLSWPALEVLQDFRWRSVLHMVPHPS